VINPTFYIRGLKQKLVAERKHNAALLQQMRDDRDLIEQLRTDNTHLRALVRYVSRGNTTGEGSSSWEGAQGAIRVDNRSGYQGDDG
jgi:hypothetical protein